VKQNPVYDSNDRLIAQFTLSAIVVSIAHNTVWGGGSTTANAIQ
jgi:hypothetical protein